METDHFSPGHLVTGDILSSLKMMLAGISFFLLFLLIAIPAAYMPETSILTRVAVVIGLIPPPICFGIGIRIACAKESPVRTGIWANVAAMVIHAVLSAAVLQVVMA